MRVAPIEPSVTYDLEFWDGKAWDEARREGSQYVSPIQPGSNERARGIISDYIEGALQGSANTVHEGDAVIVISVDGKMNAVVGMSAAQARVRFVEVDELPALPASTLTDELPVVGKKGKK